MKPGGSGKLNDSNITRRSYKESTEMTGLNDELGQSEVILQNLSSGFEVDATAFDKNANETQNSLTGCIVGST